MTSSPDRAPPTDSKSAWLKNVHARSCWVFSRFLQSTAAASHRSARSASRRFQICKARLAARPFRSCAPPCDAPPNVRRSFFLWTRTMTCHRLTPRTSRPDIHALLPNTPWHALSSTKILDSAETLLHTHVLVLECPHVLWPRDLRGGAARRTRAVNPAEVRVDALLLRDADLGPDQGTAGASE